MNKIFKWFDSLTVGLQLCMLLVLIFPACVFKSLMDLQPDRRLWVALLCFYMLFMCVVGLLRIHYNSKKRKPWG